MIQNILCCQLHNQFIFYINISFARSRHLNGSWEILDRFVKPNVPKSKFRQTSQRLERNPWRTTSNGNSAYLNLIKWSRKKILGGESFTRWLVWGASASTRELGKIAKFLHLTAWKCMKFKIKLPASWVWVFTPPMIVRITQAEFIFKQKDDS